MSAVASYRRIGAQRAWTALDQHRFWHELGAGGIDAILLASAQYLGSAGNDLKQRDWLEFVDAMTALLDVYFNRYAEIVEPALLLDGNDICRLCDLAAGTANRRAADGAARGASHRRRANRRRGGRIRCQAGCQPQQLARLLAARRGIDKAIE